MNDLIGHKFPVLDDGYVLLADVMGNDAAICDAARVSFGAGTRSVSDDRTLIRYLMRHQHGSPLEMAEIKLKVRVPMDSWRQWIRHRTANVNEYSTRYSEAIDSAQRTSPDAWRLQATGNKQGSGGMVTEWPEGSAYDPVEDRKLLTGEPDGYHLNCPNAEGFSESYWSPSLITPGSHLTRREAELQALARQVYEERLIFGVAREQARKDLPLSTYTEAYWKCDLRNVLGFLALRMDSHAQAEIRAYADVIGREIIAKLFPLTWEAFEDYRLNAVTLTGPEIRLLLDYFRGMGRDELEDQAECLIGALPAFVTNARERDECRAKLGQIGFLPEGGAA